MNTDSSLPLAAGQPQPEPRIAVIAVHGVADQAPGDSAEAIVALLLSRSEGEAQATTCYEPFQSRTIYVPLAPALAGAVASDFVKAAAKARGAGITPEELKAPADAPTLRERIATTFQESKPGYRATLQEASHDGGQGAAPAALADDRQSLTEDAGLTYMRSLLGPYHGKAGRQSYKTLRLEGKRCAPPGGPALNVDVYEMYWADLSQVGSGPVRVFTSLYQLVLHISELGRRALEDGFSEFGSSESWKKLVRAQELAVRQLTVAIPLFNLVLLLTLLGAIVARLAGETVTLADGTPIPATDTFGLRLSAIGGMIALTVGIAYRVSLENPTVRGWWVRPILSVFLGAAIGYGAVELTDHPNLVLIGECWIVAIIIVEVISKKYDRVRPGALESGRLIVFAAAVVFGLALVAAIRAGLHPREIEYASLWTLQILNVLLTIFWLLTVGWALRASWLGQRIVSSLTGPQCSRARAAVRTSRLTIGISASAMLAILVIVWSGLLAWGVSRAAAFDCMEATIVPALRGLDWLLTEPAAIARWLGSSPECAAVNFDTQSYFRAVLLMGVTTGLPVSLFLVTLCVLLLVWMAMPSVRFEGESPSKCTNSESEKAGLWLSRGLDATKIVAYMWWTAVFVTLVVFGIGDFAMRHGWDLKIFGFSVFGTTRDLALPLLTSVGTVVAASAAALAYGVAKYGGSALDVLLDVDNYLRERPPEAAPRALIAERYASLLRYVAHDRGKTDRPYDAIVIVAHSLGALISCDLLRFFTAEQKLGRGDPALDPLGFGDSRRPNPARIPIHLFTMGNPLRQLLSRFFPHQYRWVREEPDNAMRAVEASGPYSILGSPSADALGVLTWTNAYRSGDYVGRGLWLSEWYRRTGSDKPEDGAYPQPIRIFQGDRVAEMCIGLGAHTHYWDETAPDIRDQLDLLIVRSGLAALAP